MRHFQLMLIPIMLFSIAHGQGLMFRAMQPLQVLNPLVFPFFIIHLPLSQLLPFAFQNDRKGSTYGGGVGWYFTAWAYAMTIYYTHLWPYMIIHYTHIWSYPPPRYFTAWAVAWLLVYGFQLRMVLPLRDFIEACGASIKMPNVGWYHGDTSLEADGASGETDRLLPNPVQSTSSSPGGALTPPVLASPHPSMPYTPPCIPHACPIPPHTHTHIGEGWGMRVRVRVRVMVRIEDGG